MMYQNLKFKTKILILCFTLSLIPILVLGFFALHQSRKQLTAHEETYIRHTLDSAVLSLKHNLEVHENIITTLAWDETIQHAVDKEYTSNYEMFLANLEIFDSKFPQVQAMHPEIDGITLYTDTNLYPHGTTLAKLEDLTKYAWYDESFSSTKPLYVADPIGQEINLVYTLPCKYYTNILLMRLSYNSLFEDYSTLFEDHFAVGIFDQNNKLIYRYSTIKDGAPTNLFCGSLEATLQVNHSPNFFREYRTDDEYGFTVMLYRPSKYITASANSFIPVVLWIILFCIVLIGLVGIRLSSQLVEPLEKLTKNMEQIQADNFTVTVDSPYNDEVSKLIRSFKAMAERLESTIEELYTNKILKQEYRLAMLQSQINPHFLYNCLSLINAKAIRAEEPQISKMALHLSTFYRTTLNKGHNFIRLADEWKNTTSYLEIQKMLHSSSFEVYTHVDESLLNQNVINLLIQPLAENAILHGLDYRDENDTSEKYIDITICSKDDKLLIVVKDNGCGMDEETLESITTTETKGYGIRNVDQRIKLFFGEEYGISYESQVGVGTTATITLPITGE